MTPTALHEREQTREVLPNAQSEQVIYRPPDLFPTERRSEVRTQGTVAERTPEARPEHTSGEYQRSGNTLTSINTYQL